MTEEDTMIGAAHTRFKALWPEAEGSADELLKAIVIFIRRDAYTYKLKKLVQCYPRITNRANPFVSLLEEIDSLRQQLSAMEDEVVSLRALKRMGVIE